MDNGANASVVALALSASVWATLTAVAQPLLVGLVVGICGKALDLLARRVVLPSLVDQLYWRREAKRLERRLAELKGRDDAGEV